MNIGRRVTDPRSALDEGRHRSSIGRQLKIVNRQCLIGALTSLLSVVACTTRDAPELGTGLGLRIDPGSTLLTIYPEVRESLMDIGIGVWPLRLDDLPAEIRGLLARDKLTEQETARIRDHFLLPRERLLEIIAESGRAPNVPGGGALETTVANQGYGYPQLWVVQDDVDYTRFDRFHVNVADDGTGVDEVLQMVWGQGVIVRNRQADGTIYTLRLDCPSADVCWLISYDAGDSHIGSLSSATPGTKLVVQAIGPREWSLRYAEGVD